ncbi:MAG: redoxin domain-containing protein, partial [Chloroflexi bacterium]|nr:redoxin domain-containing protein [Chloroflexota bacterium]
MMKSIRKSAGNSARIGLTKIGMTACALLLVAALALAACSAPEPQTATESPATQSQQSTQSQQTTAPAAAAPTATLPPANTPRPAATATPIPSKPVATTEPQASAPQASAHASIVTPATGDEKTVPEIRGIESWINSDPFTFEEQRGKVVLVDFWTYTCVNCIRTLPFLKAWHEKYADKGLVIVGIHTPEFEFEKDRENVVEATEGFGLE